MTTFALLAAALFLPLFPASMLFSLVYARIANVWVRMALLLAWPQIGLLVLVQSGAEPPEWVAYWAVFTAALYGFRAVALRDLALWTAFMAVASWSLLWVAVMFGTADVWPYIHAVGLSIPFMLLAWITARLVAACGAAFAGACGGLAMSMPRISLVLVLAILAAVGTPLFPAFFTMLMNVTGAIATLPGVALAILLVWMLWAWASGQLIRGMVVGPASGEPATDLGRVATTASLAILGAVAAAGLVAAGRFT
ncbi:MAG: hypothetical protein KDG50_02085 [Chromatiales bacterium]|nr:hypothetical protein [Chromatiales bacterium]